MAKKQKTGIFGLTPQELLLTQSFATDAIQKENTNDINRASIFLGQAPRFNGLIPNVESKQKAISGADKLTRSQDAKLELLKRLTDFSNNARNQEDFSKKTLPTLSLNKSIFQ